MRDGPIFYKTLVVAFFFMAGMVCIVGTGGGGGGSDSAGTDSASQTAALQEYLDTFNLTMDWVAEDFPSLVETVDQLNTAMEEDDGSAEKTSEINLLVDQFEFNADMLAIDVETMDATEVEIQKITNPKTSVASSLSTDSGAGQTIKDLLSFASKLRGLGNSMSKAREKRTEALLKGDDEGYNKHYKEMKDLGAETISEVTKKAYTDKVLSPVTPPSTSGVNLKDITGKSLPKDLKVISSTKECEGGYDSPDCKIGVSVIDKADSAVTPDGKITIVVAGGDMAREVIKEEISPDSFTEVTIDPIPIDAATPEKIADSDNAANGDDDTPVTPTMTLSASVSSENDTNITYSVTATLTGITDPTTVTITVEDASTGTSKKTMTADGPVVWSVIVADEDATVTVRRSDTGDQESLILSAINYDGEYVGTVSVTYDPENICLGSEESVKVSGSSISGDGVGGGTIVGNEISFTAGDWVFSGTIADNVMSGAWHDTTEPCSGTFSFAKQ